MASVKSRTLKLRETFPIELYWTRSENDEVPVINMNEDDELRPLVFEKFDVESVDELAEMMLSDYQRDTLKQQRLGLLVGEKAEDAEFLTEAEVLAVVDGIDDDLAENIIDWFDDIPSLCRAMRRDRHLSSMYHDVYTEAENDADTEWVEEVEGGPDLERRIKKARLWVEPDDVVAS